MIQRYDVRSKFPLYIKSTDINDLCYGGEVAKLEEHTAKLEAEDTKNLKMIQKLKDENKILWRIIKEFKETYTDNADEIKALETGGCISLK